MKKSLMLAIAGCAIFASAACGGGGSGSGHSKSYDAGYAAGDSLTNFQLQVRKISCGVAYERATGGINKDEFLQGCADAAQKHSKQASTSTSAP
jgi:hypothetical protein